MLTPAQQMLVVLLDQEVNEMKFGSLTMTVIIKNQEPVLKSVSFTTMKRRKYKYLDKSASNV